MRFKYILLKQKLKNKKGNEYSIHRTILRKADGRVPLEREILKLVKVNLSLCLAKHYAMKTY
jgi:hypothetical protein